MSIFHIAPAAHFYNYIQLESQEVRDTSAGGIVCYNGTTDYGALYVSVPNDSSTYEYRALIDKLDGSNGISVIQDEKDKGKWTIVSGVQVVKVTIKKDIFSGSDTKCYADIKKDTRNGFVYRAYDDNGNAVAVTVYTYSPNPRYITIDFGSSTLNTTVYIDIIVGAAFTSVNASNALPGQQSPGVEQ